MYSVVTPMKPNRPIPSLIDMKNLLGCERLSLTHFSLGNFISPAIFLIKFAHYTLDFELYFFSRSLIFLWVIPYRNLIEEEEEAEL